MTVDDWLRISIKRLKDVGVGSARLDALILLEDCLKLDRAHLLAHPETPLQGVSLKKLDGLLTRRLSHEPLAYIRRAVEFYGRDFYVDQRVMTPRPETETIIELLKQLNEDRRLKIGDGGLIVDVGTGSGCLAITAKLELPGAVVVAMDISQAALQVARRNAKRYKAKVELLRGDLLQPLRNSEFGIRNSIILANLPYVPDKYKVNRAVLHEPKVAIFAGADGMDIYRQFWDQLAKFEPRPRFILTESLPPQHSIMIKLALGAGFKLQESKGLIQLFTP